MVDNGEVCVATRLTADSENCHGHSGSLLLHNNFLNAPNTFCVSRQYIMSELV